MNNMKVTVFLFKVVIFMPILLITLPVTVFFKEFLAVGVINFIHRTCDECVTLEIATQKQVDEFISEIGL